MKKPRRQTRKDEGQSQDCPHCGKCPHCGRSDFQPYAPPVIINTPPQPFMPQPWQPFNPTYREVVIGPTTIGPTTFPVRSITETVSGNRIPVGSTTTVTIDALHIEPWTPWVSGPMQATYTSGGIL